MKAIRLLLMSVLVGTGFAALAQEPKPAEEPKSPETQEQKPPEAPAAAEESKAPPDPQKAAPDLITAIWKDQEIDFFYHSQDAIYSCGALQSRVASIMRAVGADNVKVSANDCDDFIFAPEASGDILRPQLETDRFGSRRRTDRQQVSHVRISFKSPVLATPDALAELGKDKGRRELIARVTGNNAALQEATGIFPAHWQAVSLSRGGPLRLEPEECELVEQMSMSVLPKLGVRIVNNNLLCVPHQISLLQPRLQVEALVKDGFNNGSTPKSKKSKKSKQEATPAPAEAPPAESGSTESPAPPAESPSTPPPQ